MVSCAFRHYFYTTDDLCDWLGYYLLLEYGGRPAEGLPTVVAKNGQEGKMPHEFMIGRKATFLHVTGTFSDKNYTSRDFRWHFAAISQPFHFVQKAWHK